MSRGEIVDVMGQGLVDVAQRLGDVRARTTRSAPDPVVVQRVDQPARFLRPRDVRQCTNPSGCVLYNVGGSGGLTMPIRGLVVAVIDRRAFPFPVGELLYVQVLRPSASAGGNEWLFGETAWVRAADFSSPVIQPVVGAHPAWT